VTNPAQYPFPNWAASADAGWISPQADYTANSDNANTSFTFATFFTLPADFLSASIVMRLATDNALQDVRLNGVSIDFAKTAVVLPGNATPTNVILEGTGFSTGLGAPLSIVSGFQPGQNTLEFYVRNSATDVDNHGNPTGMIGAFNGEVTAPGGSEIDSPEPASLVLFAIGLAAFGSLAARRRLSENDN
jgi:hypothetical protein